MTWGEAQRLITILRADPSTALAAAVEGWDHPISREALALYDIFDLDAMVNSDKRHRPKPHHGRPWKDDSRSVQRMGNVGGRSPEQVRAILAAARDGKVPV